MRTALKQDLHPSHFATPSTGSPGAGDDSVNVRISQLKGVANELNSRRPRLQEDDFDHIEAKKNIRIA